MTAEKIFWGAVVNQAVMGFVSPGYVYDLDNASITKIDSWSGFSRIVVASVRFSSSAKLRYHPELAPKRY
jgi:hypothetical protein